MNWVGGSRNRIIFKQEKRKQREFFEKNKLRSKLKLLGSASLNKPTISLDILNLYIANQISKKKDTGINTRAGNSGVARKVAGKNGFVNLNWTGGRNNAELPMSPISTPSKLCLDDYDTAVLQAKHVEDTAHPDASNDLPNQELSKEEKRYTIDNKYRKEVQRTKMHTGSEIIPGAKQYFHGNSINAMFSKEERLSNMLPLQSENCVFPQMTVWCQSSTVACSSGKCDKAIQCSVAQECEFANYTSDFCSEAARNNFALDAIRWQSRLDGFHTVYMASNTFVQNEN